MTPIVNAIAARSNLITFHGPMAAQIASTQNARMDNAQELGRREVDLILQAVNGQPVDLTPVGDEVHIMSYKPVNLKVERINCPARAEGLVIAGHFQGFWTLAGTKWALLPDRRTPKLLFLEALHTDQSYNLRAMEHMRTLGYFENAVFCTGVNYADSTGEFLRKYSDEFNLPVVWGLRFGHLIPSAVLPIGAYATLDIRNLVLHASRPAAQTSFLSR